MGPGKLQPLVQLSHLSLCWTHQWTCQRLPPWASRGHRDLQEASSAQILPSTTWICRWQLKQSLFTHSWTLCLGPWSHSISQTWPKLSTLVQFQFIPIPLALGQILLLSCRWQPFRFWFTPASFPKGSSPLLELWSTSRSELSRWKLVGNWQRRETICTPVGWPCKIQVLVPSSNSFLGFGPLLSRRCVGTVFEFLRHLQHQCLSLGSSVCILLKIPRV